MRTISALVLAAALALPSAAPAAQGGFAGPGNPPQAGQQPSGFSGPGAGGYARPGGFTGPTAQGRGVSTAADARNARDDSYCVLEGYIINRISKDHYTFRDQTGTVVVDIDDEDFHGRTVTPETRVRLVGEVDRDFGRVKVDVDHLEVLR